MKYLKFKNLARKTFPCKIFQGKHFLAKSCKACVFCKDLVRSLQGMHSFTTRVKSKNMGAPNIPKASLSRLENAFFSLEISKNKLRIFLIFKSRTVPKKGNILVSNSFEDHVNTMKISNKYHSQLYPFEYLYIYIYIFIFIYLYISPVNEIAVIGKKLVRIGLETSYSLGVKTICLFVCLFVCLFAGRVECYKNG